jgi:hypothetical protein
MEAIDGFKYKRRAKALKTSDFSYEDVVTPGAKRAVGKTVQAANKGDVAKPAHRSESNPRHDPNAKTRPSKRHAEASNDSNEAHVADKKRDQPEKKKGKAKKRPEGHVSKEVLIGTLLYKWLHTCRPLRPGAFPQWCPPG